MTMMYDVHVKGLGGPMGEFCDISYQVEAGSYGEAIDKAVVAANEDLDKAAARYVNQKANRYNLYSLTVSMAMQVKRKL